MNKIANATLALLILTSCQENGVGQVKGSEPVNKNLTIVSSRSVLENKVKEMKFTQPVKAEVKKEFKNTVHKEVKADKQVVRKSNAIVKKENDKTKINKSTNKKYVKEMTVDATAYTISEGGWSKSNPNYGLTSSGVRARVGVTVAMDRSIPYGTVILLPDGSTRINQDSGGRIKQGKLDLLVASRSQAREFGRKKSYKIKIIKWGSNKTYHKK